MQGTAAFPLQCLAYQGKILFEAPFHPVFDRIHAMVRQMALCQNFENLSAFKTHNGLLFDGLAGFKKNFPLVCKALQRERRRKMKDMKLWEKRRKIRKK
ncbi:hypothetical protein AGMMS50248_02340 [Deltaproteobacteria bacterium]|nr:hypothetical protein AGMMS50248_02340 [Deltaproteobacteria bacterium]